ncbi:MAG: hypothetical protein JO076_02800, partial [Verrucomicrobia bacterium]|nr:hypothetical protein [Verrucomicrobiota bacterium]
MMREQKKLTILEIGHDPWLGSRHNADFLQAGARLVPGKFGQEPGWKEVLPILFRLAKRKYDVIAICQLQVDRLSGLGKKGRLLKKFLAIAMHSRTSSWLLRQILCGSKAVVVVFDNGYEAKLSEAALKIFQPVLYFKRNLLEGYLAGKQGLYRVLPMAVVPQLKMPKTYDVFAAGSFFVAGRKLTLLAAQGLEELGWKVDIVKNTIPYEEYRHRLARAKVAFCVQGFGFHTWRMYEAALAGCVPVIDHPKEPIFH